MSPAAHLRAGAGAHAGRSLADTDPAVREALDNEARRQRDRIELIASENVMSRAVREALGHEMGNKTLEGYPGNRFHGGGEFVDVVERLAIERARELFGAAYANVQPHSGTQANQAVFFALVRPGDRVLSLDLAAGGHLSHGAAANLSGRWFDSHHYGVDRGSGLLDYDAVEARAREVRPALLIAGGSAYPRAIDFGRMARIARAAGARLLVDMAHIAGLVAAGVHASPVPHADIVTCTTTKTLRRPLGGVILARSDEFARRLQSAVFPGVQGSLHSNVLAAKAVCLGEALRPEFGDYGRRVVENARALAAAIRERGIGIVGGGTDTHMVLLDLSSVGLLGRQAETALARAGITSNTGTRCRSTRAGPRSGRGFASASRRRRRAGSAPPGWKSSARASRSCCSRRAVSIPARRLRGSDRESPGSRRAPARRDGAGRPPGRLRTRRRAWSCGSVGEGLALLGEGPVGGDYVEWLPERLENAPSRIEVARLTAALVDLFCRSFPAPPATIMLDIDDTCDAVHSLPPPTGGGRSRGSFLSPSSAWVHVTMGPRLESNPVGSESGSTDRDAAHGKSQMTQGRAAVYRSEPAPKRAANACPYPALVTACPCPERRLRPARS